MNCLLVYDKAGRERNGWFIDELTLKLSSHGVNVRLAIAEETFFCIKNGKTCVCEKNGVVLKPDIAVVRTISPLISHHLEQIGVKVFNSAYVSEICNDKRASHLLASSLEIPTLDTVFCDKRRFESNGVRYPCVVKSASGHGGNEVFLVSCAEELEACMDRIQQNEFLIQELASDVGRDIRVYVLGGKTLAMMKRSSESDFRSNFSLGGHAERAYEARLGEYAEKIAEHIKADFIGVDFIFHHGKPYLNELEDAVGTRMLYSLTDIDVCELYAKHIVNSTKSAENT